MITEDYVSFETAKLLKEKGFDEICFTWYTGKGKFKQGKNTYDDYHMNHFQDMDVAKCSAPTLQMAMKWLREVQGLNIEIITYWTKDKNMVYGNRIVHNNAVLKEIDTAYNSYEQACNEAIKYCLETLI